MQSVHYINGAFVPEDEAHLSVHDLAVLRGYGVFDYVPIYSGKPFHLMAHLKRLEFSARQLALSLPLSLDDLYDLTHALIAKNVPIDAGIRLIVTGGISDNCIQLMHPPSLLLLFHPLVPNPPSYYQQGLRLITTQLIRPLPAVKSLNYLPAVLAMRHAKQAGAHDALFMTSQNEILEATTSNIFFLKENRLITTDCDRIVKGVTRHVVLELAKQEYSLEFRALPLDEVASCQEAFLTASKKDLIPVAQINGITIGNGQPGPQTEHLREQFRHSITEHILQASRARQWGDKMAQKRDSADAGSFATASVDLRMDFLS